MISIVVLMEIIREIEGRGVLEEAEGWEVNWVVIVHGVWIVGSGRATEKDAAEINRYHRSKRAIFARRVAVCLLAALISRALYLLYRSHLGQSLFDYIRQGIHDAVEHFSTGKGSHTQQEETIDKYETVSPYIPVPHYVASILEEFKRASAVDHTCIESYAACTTLHGGTDRGTDRALLRSCIQRSCESHMLKTCSDDSYERCEAALHHYYDMEIFSRCSADSETCINSLVAECGARIAEKCYPALLEGECARGVLKEMNSQLRQVEASTME
jgi:hypothetical protein